jgi:hypothetical protein
MTSSEIDELVLRSIRCGNRTASSVCFDVERRGIDVGGSNRWRTIDRALQRLRKRGVINYTRSWGWKVK